MTIRQADQFCDIVRSFNDLCKFKHELNLLSRTLPNFVTLTIKIHTVSKDWSIRISAQLLTKLIAELEGEHKASAQALGVAIEE